MLKIIAGTARGRRLQSLPKDFPVRPILARIKKSLFDIIKISIPGSRFLDLYAGTGAVGIEALSRGAKQVTFVEKDPHCVRVIQGNLDHLNLSGNGVIYRADARQDLSFLPKPYDVVFMGPPYKDENKAPLSLVHPTLEGIFRSSLLSSEGLVAAQHHKKEYVSSTPEWILFRQSTYGDSSVSFFRLRR